MEHRELLGQLPYAENIVNLLIADLDLLGTQAPTEREMLRVIVPDGIAYLCRNGTWRATRKPRPAEMDDWPMYNHGADGNPLSRDALVKPPTSLKWIAWYAAFANNGEGLHGPFCFELVSSGGRAYQHYLFVNGANDKSWYVSARDAFNGISLWQKPALQRNVSPMIAIGDTFYAALTKGDYLCAYDGATGNKLGVFDKGGRLGTWYHQLFTIVSGTTMIQVKDSCIIALDTRTGNLKWKYVDPQSRHIHLPAVSQNRNELYAAAGKPGARIYLYRYVRFDAESIFCLDLATGSQKWQVPSPASTALGQLIYSDNKLAYYVNYVASPGVCDMGVIDASNGRALWKGEATEGGGRPVGITNCPELAAVADGELYNMFKDKFYAHKIESGLLSKKFTPRIPNQRCVKPAITLNYTLLGFTEYIQRDLRWSYHNVARSTCGSPVFPANGMTYYGPNGECGCLVRLRTATAFSSEPLLPEVALPKRLTRGIAWPPPNPPAGEGTPGPSKFGATGSDASSSWKSELIFASRKPVITASPIRDDWNNTDMIPPGEAQSCTYDGRTYVAVTNEHRMECRQGSTVVWRFTAGARIVSNPVFSHGLCIFGSSDGFVYAVRHDDGKMVWRFLAGRNERRMVAFSQIESVSPVFGVILHEGNVCFAAGRHPQIDGGIYVWGLRPATGEPVWQSIIRDDPPVIGPTETAYLTKRNNILGGILRANGSAVTLPGITIDAQSPVNPVRVRNGIFSRSSAPKLKLTRHGCEFNLSPDVHQSEVRISVADMLGRTMLTYRIFAGLKGVIPIQLLGSGTYVVNIEIGGTRYSHRVRSR